MFVNGQRVSSHGTANAEGAKGEESVGRTGPRSASKRTPAGTRVVRIVSDKREERKAERSNGGAEMKARDDGRS